MFTGPVAAFVAILATAMALTGHYYAVAPNNLPAAAVLLAVCAWCCHVLTTWERGGTVSLIALAAAGLLLVLVIAGCVVASVLGGLDTPVAVPR